MSRGNPVPWRLIKKPPLFPPEVGVTDEVVRGMLKGEMPEARPAIPIGEIDTTGVTSPATRMAVPSVFVAMVQVREA